MCTYFSQIRQMCESEKTKYFYTNTKKTYQKLLKYVNVVETPKTIRKK